MECEAQRLKRLPNSAFVDRRFFSLLCRIPTLIERTTKCFEVIDRHEATATSEERSTVGRQSSDARLISNHTGNRNQFVLSSFRFHCKPGNVILRACCAKTCEVTNRNSIRGRRAQGNSVWGRNSVWGQRNSFWGQPGNSVWGQPQTGRHFSQSDTVCFLASFA